MNIFIFIEIYYTYLEIFLNFLENVIYSIMIS